MFPFKRAYCRSVNIEPKCFIIVSIPNIVRVRTVFSDYANYFRRKIT